ncbi:hypothetical protein D3C71_947790 [compost metagenome]
MGLVAKGVELLDRLRLTLPQHRLRGRRGVSLLPGVFCLCITQAQAVVLGQQLLQGTLQRFDVQRLARHQQQRLVPVLTLGDRLFEEPLLHRRQRHCAHRRTLIDRRLLASACRLGEAADGLMLEQVLGTEHDTGLPRTADHLHRDDGVAAQFKEIVFQADAVDGQHVLPDSGEGFFQFAAWRDVFALLSRSINRRQGLAVEFAVRRQRQVVKEQQERRDHVVRQMLTQRSFQRLAQGRLRLGIDYQR